MATESRPTGPLLSVRGEATLEVAPEIVGLTITISARDTKRERVLEALSRRNDECLSLLKGCGDGVEKIETTGLCVYPETAWFTRKERVRSYEGTIRIHATIVDFSSVGELAARLADNDMTTLAGPWWRLRPGSPVHRQVRQEAARDAVERARAYAEAIGSRLTGLVEMADEAATLASVRSAADEEFMRSYAAGERAEPPPIQLEPQRQVVSARVAARFTISEPEQL